MKPGNLGILGLVLSLLLIGSKPLLAQDNDLHHFAFGVQTGLQAIGNGSFRNSETSFEPSEVFGIHLSYLPTQLFSLELSVDRSRTDFDVSLDSKSEPFGSLRRHSIRMTGLLHGRTNVPNLDLYAGAGVGYTLNDIETKRASGDPVSDFPPLNVSVEDTEPGFEVHGNLGVEYFFRNNLAFDVDMKISFSQSTIKLAHPDATTTEVDHPFNAFMMGAGLKYYFW